MGSLVQFIRLNDKSGSATQILVTAGINIGFLVMFLACWPFKSLDDNMLMALSLVAITVTLFCALAVNADIGVMDAWGETTTLGVLLGVNCTLILMYAAMMYHFQMPFICNHLVPPWVQNSWLNCFTKGSKQKLDGAGNSREETKEEKEEEEAREAAKAKATEDNKVYKLKYAQIEFVRAPEPPIAPLPYADLDMSDEELEAELEKYFHRYDLDESGDLNGNEELQQLCTNLCFKLGLELAGDEIDAVVDCAGNLDDDNAWNVEEFCEWFSERFLGGDAEDQSFSAEMMNAIGMYQNMEMMEDAQEEEEEEEDDDDDGDCGGE